MIIVFELRAQSSLCKTAFIFFHMKGFHFFSFTGIVAAVYQLCSTACNGVGHDGRVDQYASYQSIDSADRIECGGSILELLLESEENIQPFLTMENNVIIYTVHGNGHTFYKIGPNGNIVDTLVLDRKAGDLSFVKGFIIDKEANQYYRWCFNGVKDPLEIQRENIGLDWDVVRQRKRLDEIKAMQGHVYVDYRSIAQLPEKAGEKEIQATQSPLSFSVLNYFSADTCYQFYTTVDISREFPWSATQQLLWNNLFRRLDENSVNKSEIIPSPAIRYRYFHRQKKEKVEFSGPGGNAAGFTADLYPGFLFADIAFQKDTIKIKEFMFLEQERPQSSITINGVSIGNFTKNKKQPLELIDGYMYYTNPKLQYALFSNSSKRIYRIRPKEIAQ